jgi:hypothetical protein
VEIATAAVAEAGPAHPELEVMEAITLVFMPHPVPDDKCEKKYWLKVLALNLNHFGKKIDICLLLLKNPNDFFYMCS